MGYGSRRAETKPIPRGEDAASGRVPPVVVASSSSSAAQWRAHCCVAVLPRVLRLDIFLQVAVALLQSLFCALAAAWTAAHGWRCWLTRHVLRQMARRSAARGPCGAPSPPRWARCRRTAAGRCACSARRARSFAVLRLGAAADDASCRAGRCGATARVERLRAEQLPRAGLGVRCALACVYVLSATPLTTHAPGTRLKHYARCLGAPPRPPARGRLPAPLLCPSCSR